MIKVFKKVRQRLLSVGQTGKYLKYAIGEIVLVVVGILIALQVNNWNESRKEGVQEIRLYENLMNSLLADSADVVWFTHLINAGAETQMFFISHTYQDLIENYTLQQLEDSIKAVGKVGASFFPRYSAYELLSNNGVKMLLRSEEIKLKLVELYERRYKRYVEIDDRIDEKSELHLKPIVNGDLQIFFGDFHMHPASGFDLVKFEKYYPNLLREFSSLLSTAYIALDALGDCKVSIEELLVLIRSELATLKRKKF